MDKTFEKSSHRYCCCFKTKHGFIFCLLFTILILLGLALTLFFLWPRIPTISISAWDQESYITAVQVNTVESSAIKGLLNANSSYPFQLIFNVVFNVTAYNPNYIDVYVNSITTDFTVLMDDQTELNNLKNQLKVENSNFYKRTTTSVRMNGTVVYELAQPIQSIRSDPTLNLFYDKCIVQQQPITLEYQAHLNLAILAWTGYDPTITGRLTPTCPKPQNQLVKGAYSNLKKLIYTIEREQLDSSWKREAEEQDNLLDSNQEFISMLDSELDKICRFYHSRELEIAQQVKDLQLVWVKNSTTTQQEDQSQVPLKRTMSSPSTSKAMDVPLMQAQASEPLSVPFKGKPNELARMASELFIELTNLKEFVLLNYTGFQKILKKYEKVTGKTLKKEYMTKVNASYPFLETSNSNLDKVIEVVIELYASMLTNQNKQLAKEKLLANVHERVVFYRNTIWKDMIEYERKNETLGLVSSNRTLQKSEATPLWTFNVCGMSMSIPTIPLQFWLLLIGCIVLICLVQFPIFSTPEQNNCFAILVFVSYLWAFEVLPLFVTALCVPFLVVVLRVMREVSMDEKGNEHSIRLDSKLAAKKIFSEMFGPVIMLLLGGFAIAAALSKQNIAKSLAGAVLGRAGKDPKWVLLTNMFVSTFSSMWISNVAAPVLCFSLIMPILRNLPQKSNYAKALILGIAMAANVGGMASPISSPQNVIAMGTMNPTPSWIEWFVIALPICILLDLMIWMIIMAIYKPEQGTHVPEISAHSQISAFNATQYYVIFISMLTIFLWCIEKSIESVVGDMGIIAIVPILAFFGTGILTKDDWNSMLWSVVVLAMGGISLGKAVESSGLLKELTSYIIPHLAELSPFSCLVIFMAIVLLITSFISHTVGALILLPVIKQVGENLPEPLPRTLIMSAALMCSGAMGLPVSSFPNMNAISLDGPTGVPWLSVLDFLKVGLASSVMAFFVTISIGYPIMNALNFQ